MQFRFDSYCGLYCGGCGIVHSIERGTLEEMAAKWESTPEKMECYGCKSEHIAGFSQNCRIRKCAIDKGFEFCSECGEYPCETLMDFLELQSCHPKIHLNNLHRLRVKGLETWLSEQETRWRCRNCGTKFHFDEATCIQCGKEVYNMVKEAEDLKKEEA